MLFSFIHFVFLQYDWFSCLFLNQFDRLAYFLWETNQIIIKRECWKKVDEKNGFAEKKLLLNLLKHGWDNIAIKFSFTNINTERAEKFVKIMDFKIYGLSAF